MQVKVEGAEVVRGVRRLRIDRWHVPAGSQRCLAGASGSGKTTVLHLLSGLLVPTVGRVHVGDVELGALSETARDAFRARSVGYVFQDFNLLPGLSVLENVSLPQTFSGVPVVEARARAAELVGGLGLPEGRDVVELSRGERQRVAVARALAVRPGILLADEPTASLDPARRDEVLDALCSMAGEATLIVVSHDPAVQARFDQVDEVGTIGTWEGE